jgi:hypothetical protein
LRRVIAVLLVSITAQFGFTAAHASSGDAQSVIDEVFRKSFPEEEQPAPKAPAAASVAGGSGQSVSIPALPKPVVAKPEPKAPVRPSAAVSTAGRRGANDVGKAGNGGGAADEDSARNPKNEPEAERPAPRSTAADRSGARTVSSTAYCLTGTMASGRRVYWGAAAMNGTPLGSRYQVLNGPRAGETLTVEDRIGHGSAFDIAYPGDCGGARSYGRRTIAIRRV